MCDENIEIGVTEITNNILVSATPTDQIIDINVLEEVENVELTITPSVVEVNIDVTQDLITEVVTIDANTCVNIIDVTVTDATDNVVLNITPSLVEVNINRGLNNISIEEYATFADLPTIGDVNTYYITLDENKFWRWDAISNGYIEISSANSVWGQITGTLSNQTDLWEALNSKQNKLNGTGFVKASGTTISYDNSTYFLQPTGDTTQYIAGDGSLISFPIAGQSGTLVRQVRNSTGSTLTKGTVVYISGATGNKPNVSKAIATSDATSAQTFGLVQADIPNNSNGYVVCSGDLIGLDTSSFTEGQQLYLSYTNAGAYTSVKQYAPAHLVYIGVITRSHPTQGQIEVKIQNGYELDELHNVSAQSPSNKDGIFYNSSTNLWEKSQLSSIISASNPLTFASNVISISQANATTNGYLSSTDWNYFSAKQQALSGTGFVKISGSIISYDNTVYTPQGRTLTINGTSYDLSADRSWSISVGSGMRNVSSFVATAGQTTFTITGGYTAGLVDVYVNGTRLNASDYTASNGTTVVLGTGLVANDIVDIINYVAGLTSGTTGSGTTNYIPKWSSSSNLTNSLLFDNGTNIGLGTITPDSLFHIYYNSIGATFNDIAHIGSGAGKSLFIGTNGYGFSLNDSASRGGWGIDSDSDSGFMRFYYGASEKMRIQSNGYVGIGLTYASYKLDVAGDINVTGNFKINGVNIASGTVTSVSALTIGTTGTDITSSVANSTTTPVITLNIPTASATNRGALSSADWTTFNSKQSALTNPVTGTGTSGYLAKWNATNTINSSIIYDNGTNVGIGMTTPLTYKLNVNGEIFAWNMWTQQSAWTIGTPSNYAAITGFGSTGYLGTTNTLAFYTNTAERMRIDSSGNLIVGGTTSTSILTINEATYPILSFNSGNINRGSVGFNGATSTLNLATSSTIPIVFYTNNTERMRILSGGSVGIGTSSPTKTLSVYSSSTVDTAQVKIGSASSTPQLYLGSFSGSAYINYGGNYSSGWSTDGTNAVAGIVMEASNNNSTISFATVNSNNSPLERMRIISDGRVGIGTSAPGTLLQVAGGISSYNGFVLAISGVWTAVYTFATAETGGGSFTYFVAGTNNSLTCLYTKNWNGGASQLVIGSTTASNASTYVRANGNSIEINQGFGVSLYCYWALQKIM